MKGIDDRARSRASIPQASSDRASTGRPGDPLPDECSEVGGMARFVEVVDSTLEGNEVAAACIQSGVLKVHDSDLTVSGGEPLAQTSFTRALLAAAKERGIHTCLDTNGFTQKPIEIVNELLDVTDLVMLDLKQMDDEIHRNLIGVPNRRVLEFARHLHERKQKTWIRFVVVPSYHDEESAHQLGEFIKGMDNIEKIELLPYHKLGVHKWETLGFEYQLEGISAPPKEDLDRMKGILEGYGDWVVC